jgi:GNAT superfamily N-acetyltransferase
VAKATPLNWVLCVIARKLVQIRQLVSDDIIPIADAFAAIGWSIHKPLSQYKRYYAEQCSGDREVLVAFSEDKFAGYLTIVWKPDYQPFQDAGVPEVQDFNVLPEFRRRKIGTALMDHAEEFISTRSKLVGIGVGMYPDYGNAQRLYVKRGYIPDGRGLTYSGNVLEPMETAINDDDLVLYFTKDLL